MTASTHRPKVWGRTGHLFYSPPYTPNKGKLNKSFESYPFMSVFLNDTNYIDYVQVQLSSCPAIHLLQVHLEPQPCEESWTKVKPGGYNKETWF